MFIKIGIIAGILILGGMIFSTEMNHLFPTTSAVAVESLKNDVENLSLQATDLAEKRIDESANKIVNKTSNTLENGINNVENKITSEIYEVKESSQKIIHEKVSQFDPLEPIQNFLKSFE